MRPNLVSPIQEERGAAAAPLAGEAGPGSAEGAGGSAGAAQPAAGRPNQAAVERCLGPRPAVPGARGQGGDPELGRRAATPLAAPQVCWTGASLVLQNIVSIVQSNLCNLCSINLRFILDVDI